MLFAFHCINFSAVLDTFRSFPCRDKYINQWLILVNNYRYTCGIMEGGMCWQETSRKTETREAALA